MAKLIETKIAIIGTGPAGLTAAIYASRAMITPIIIDGMQPGGQLTITTDVENYPGFASPIMGPELMENMRKQAASFGTQFINDQIEKVDFSDQNNYQLFCSNGNTIKAKTIIIATGASAKWTNTLGEEKFKGYGVSACATCDGFFYKDKIVAVIGGGNTAVEEALFLTKFAKKVILIHRRNKLRAEPILCDRLQKNQKIEVIWDSQLNEIIGQDNPKLLNSIEIYNKVSLEKKTLPIDGLFIAIGHKPATEIFQGQINLDENGYITVRDNIFTNKSGIYASGDVSDYTYRQAVTAAGFGCMAALSAAEYCAN